jgi:hypothetical protein
MLSLLVLDFRNIPFGIPLIDGGMSTRKRPIFVSNYFPVAHITYFSPILSPRKYVFGVFFPLYFAKSSAGKIFKCYFLFRCV